MSLIGTDGKALQLDGAFDLAATVRPRPPPSNAPISTHNSFQFDAASSMNASSSSSNAAATINDSMSSSAATAASASSSSSSSAPGDFVPLVFAPSNAPRSSTSSSSKPSAPVQLDFSEFEEEIASMEAAKVEELRQQMLAHEQQLRRETNGLAPLPSQVGDSKLFHSMVLKQYGKIHHLGMDPKKAFVSRKKNARNARKAKKAEEKADQMEAKAGGVIRRQKHRQRAKGVY